MERTVKLKEEYASLDQIVAFIGANTSLKASKEYDHWEVRTDKNGQMEQCVLVKKSNMHGVKAYFTDENRIKVTYVIPNKVMNAYFGASTKAHRNILEIVAGGIKSVALAGSQRKAFSEIIKSFGEITEKNTGN